MATDADSVRDALKGIAYKALSRFGRPPPEQPIIGCANNKLTEVKVVIRAVNDGNNRPARRIGSWMSPTETLIVSKLDAETMTRMALAERCGMSYDPKFKTIVSNLIERGIIEDADDGKGIRAVRS